MCMAIFLHYSKSSETSGENVHLKKGSKRLKMQMLYPFIHWLTVALVLPCLEGPGLGCSQHAGEQSARWMLKFSEGWMPGPLLLLLADLT